MIYIHCNKYDFKKLVITLYLFLSINFFSKMLFKLSMKKQTKVINFFSGSGTGKSTIAAALYAELKIRSAHVELAREYIKKWAWEKRVPGKFDQIYIFGHQSNEEGRLYEKVDFIISDSPLLLVPFYEQLLTKENIIESSVMNFMKHAEKHGVSYHNFWLERLDSFDDRGRYETEDQAKQIDASLRKWLEDRNVPLTDLPKGHHQRLKIILEQLGFDYKEPLVDFPENHEKKVIAIMKHYGLNEELEFLMSKKNKKKKTNK